MIAANTALRTRNSASGSVSMPWCVWFARSRQPIATIAAATSPPSSSEVVRSSPWMKPELSIWNSPGNGPTDWPCSSASARPLKTSMPASVTMNDGMRK